MGSHARRKTESSSPACTKGLNPLRIGPTRFDTWRQKYPNSHVHMAITWASFVEASKVVGGQIHHQILTSTISGPESKLIPSTWVVLWKKWGGPNMGLIPWVSLWTLATNPKLQRVSSRHQELVAVERLQEAGETHDALLFPSDVWVARQLKLFGTLFLGGVPFMGKQKQTRPLRVPLFETNPAVCGLDWWQSRAILVTQRNPPNPRDNSHLWSSASWGLNLRFFDSLRRIKHDYINTRYMYIIYIYTYYNMYTCAHISANMCVCVLVPEV